MQLTAEEKKVYIEKARLDLKQYKKQLKENPVQVKYGTGTVLYWHHWCQIAVYAAILLKSRGIFLLKAEKS
jgi:hypothetical protein